MSTGDLKNNLQKLKLATRRIQYPQDVDIESLTKGIVSEYMPIYHYVMVQYSLPLAEKISSMGMDLAGKTDLRFIESMYKILRELFSYKPSITKDQFFSNGFAERKVIMCTEIINLVHKRHLQLGPKAGVKVPPRNFGGAVGISMVPKALSASQPSMSFSGASSTDDARHSVYKQPKHAKAPPKSGILNRSAAMATIGGRVPSGHSNVKSRVVNELRTRSPKAVADNSPIKTACSATATTDMSPPIVMKDNIHDLRSPNCGSAEVRKINSSTPTRFEEQDANLELVEKRLNALELQTDERLFCLEEKISRIEQLANNMDGITPAAMSETSSGIPANILARLTVLEDNMDAVQQQMEKSILARLTLLENKIDIMHIQNKSGLSEKSGPCNKSGSWSPTRNSDAVDDKEVPQLQSSGSQHSGQQDSLEDEKHESPIMNSQDLMGSPIIGNEVESPAVRGNIESVEGVDMDSPAIGGIQSSEAWLNACSSTPVEEEGIRDTGLVSTPGIEAQYLHPKQQEQVNNIIEKLKETSHLLQSQTVEACPAEFL